MGELMLYYYGRHQLVAHRLRTATATTYLLSFHAHARTHLTMPHDNTIMLSSEDNHGELVVSRLCINHVTVDIELWNIVAMGKFMKLRIW
jgi:precorrin-6B methylase 1